MRRWAYALTILAGTHMAQAGMWIDDSGYVPPYAPIQWYGPPPGYYGGPPPYEPRGPGWYGPRSVAPYSGGVMHPDDYRALRRWDWELRRGRGYPPPMGW